LFEPGTFRLTATELLVWQYFTDRSTLAAVQHAAMFLAGAGLVVSAAAVSGGERTDTVLRALAAGATGAACLTLLRVVGASLRSEEGLAALPELLIILRVNETHGDLNAAGSYYVLTVLVSIGLLLKATAAERRPAMGVLSLAVILQLMGLWLTGSRTAVLTLVFCGAVWLGLRLWPKISPAARTPLALALAIAGVLMAVGVVRTSQNQIDTSSALHVRTEMARVGLAMLATNPVFGVGVGRFQEMSPAFVESPIVVQYYPGGENAHNQFVQVFAELGILGGVAFLWLLGTAGKILAASHPTWTRDGLLFGFVGFLVTCLAGHPLLVREVAYPFWIAVGLAGGLGPRAVASRYPAAGGVLAALVAGIIVGFLPARIERAKAEALLEHVAVGTSLWQTDPTGVRYREFVGTATFYIPSNSLIVTCQVRTVGDVPARLHLDWGDRRVDVVEVPPHTWHSLRLPVPRGAKRDYVPLRLQASAPDGSAVPFHITKFVAVEGTAEW
jgi:O-antigen ligase